MPLIYSLSAWIDLGLFGGTKLCNAAGQGVLHALLRPAVSLCSLCIVLDVQPVVIQQQARASLSLLCGWVYSFMSDAGCTVWRFSYMQQDLQTVVGGSYLTAKRTAWRRNVCRDGCVSVSSSSSGCMLR